MGQSEKPRRIDAIKATLIAIVIVLAAVSGYLYYQNTNTNASLSALTTSYESLQASKNNLQSTYDNLQSSFNNLTTRYNSLNATTNTMRDSYESLQVELQNLTYIVSLQQSRNYLTQYKLTQGADTYNSWIFTDIQYAGYIKVQIHSSNSTNNYVEVIYNYFGSSWSLRKNLGSLGSAIFPVLPTTVEVRIGNTNPSGAWGHTVSLTYKY